MNYLFRPMLAALGLAGLAGLWSCKDYLEVTPTAVINSETIFSTTSGAFNAVVGAYAPLAGDFGYGTRISTYFPYDSDDFLNTPGGNGAGAGKLGIARYAAVATNDDITKVWDQLYRGVDRANICIRYIPEMAQYKNAADPDYATVRRLHGEALTLRAQYYLELTRNWGDVPASFVPTTTGSDFNLPRSKRNIILDKLLIDLDLAAKLVPWFSDSPTKDERITKGAVKALRARIALYRAGYYFDPVDNKTERATDYRQFLDTVRVECREIMASNQHSLYPSFEDLFKLVICGYQAEVAKPEIMFQVGMGGTGAAYDSKLGTGNGPRVANALNSPIGVANGQVSLTPTYFYAYDSTDARRDVSITLYSIDGTVKRAHTSVLDSRDGKFRREWCGNPATKANSGTAYLGYNWPLIRYADVLLMFAEADNEYGNGPSADAVTAVNAVRVRGYGTATPPAIATDYAGFRDAVRRERLLEFGGEGIRKYDLIRWNQLGDALKQVKSTMQGWANQINGQYPQYIYYKKPTALAPLRVYNSYYKPSRNKKLLANSDTVQVNWIGTNLTGGTGGAFNRIDDIASGYFRAGAYVESHQLFPIPANTLNANPNLAQNPGY